MKINIRKPLGYSQIGRKDQQEDAVWPLFDNVTVENHCIVLCDGVGGSEHGEVASQTTSKVIGEYLTKILAEKDSVTEEDLQDAVSLAYDELEKIDTPSEDGSVSMATTLTCLCIYKEGVLAAHMGDSRIYHIRPGIGLRYKSDDHSLVNALLKSGEITAEEAKTFPRKNVITKAIQPNAQKRFKAEVHLLTDIQSGDYLFLCCDGVLEQLTEERLCDILAMKVSDKEKIQLLEAESTDRTKDNYTAYLIPIDSVSGISSVVEEEIPCEVEIEAEVKPDNNVSHSSKVDNVYIKHLYKLQGKNKVIVFAVVLFLLLAILTVLNWQPVKTYFHKDETTDSIKKIFESIKELDINQESRKYEDFEVFSL